MIDWRDPDARPPRRIAPLAALRWGTAAFAVVAAHGAGAWFALTWKPAFAAPGEPPPAVMIELAPLAVSPEAPLLDVAPGPQMTEAQPETTPNVPEKPDVKPDKKPEPEAEEVKQPVDQPPPLPVPQPDVAIPKLPEKPNADAVLSPPPPKAEQKKPPPKVKKVDKKKSINHDETQADRTTAPASAPNPRADRAAAPSSSESQAPSMSPASWKGALMAHLNRYKRFPSGAAGTGTTIVAFTINRSGAVLSAHMVRSSGDPALDAAAVSLPRSASPVPAPPPNIGGGAITLAVPIRFNR